MVKLNRKTEYALLAVQYVACQNGGVTTAKEIAAACHIPYSLLAKVMQQLGNHGLIKAIQGTKGGYVMARKPEDISLVDVLEIFDGPIGMADCLREEKITCPQWTGCQIKDPLYVINQQIYRLLASTSVQDLMNQQHQHPLPSYSSKEGVSHVL